jgi:hypothetical protein
MNGKTFNHMNYKEKLDEIKALVFGKEEKLMEEAPVEESKEAAPEEAPKPMYVTAEQFSSMKDEIESFKSDITEMLSSFAEMINATDKNKVPQELSEEVKEEEVKEEESMEALSAEAEVELSKQEGGQPLVHDPEGLVSQRVKTKLSGGRRKTTEDVVFEALANAGVWNR